MEESCHCALISSFGISLAFFSSFPLSIFSLLSGSGPNSWIHQLFGRRVVHVTFSSVTCFHWVGLITLKIEMMWGQVFNKVLFSFREKRTKKSRQNDHLDGIGPIKLMRCGRQTTNDKRQSLGFWLCSVWSSSFMLQRWKISLKKKKFRVAIPIDFWSALQQFQDETGQRYKNMSKEGAAILSVFLTEAFDWSISSLSRVELRVMMELYIRSVWNSIPNKVHLLYNRKLFSKKWWKAEKEPRGHTSTLYSLLRFPPFIPPLSPSSPSSSSCVSLLVTICCVLLRPVACYGLQTRRLVTRILSFFFFVHLPSALF